MKREKEFSAAIDRRLSSLSESEARRNRIRAVVYAQGQEEKAMKRISLTVVVALVAVVLMASIAVAESLNLFNLFGQRDTRYAEVAPKATLSIAETATVERPELGTAAASIDSAYFDGLSLTLAYRISQGQKVEEYKPTETELAAMRKGDADIIQADISDNEPGIDILRAWNRALESGSPYGYRKITVYTGDHTETNDGIDVYSVTSSPMYDVNGDYCDMREFECPLPDEVRNRQELNVSMIVYQEEFCCWYDGTNCYWNTVQTEVGAMTATIPRNGETKQFAGKGTINGVACTVTAEVSSMVSVITLKSDAPFNAFLEQPPVGTNVSDCWVKMTAVDQSGKVLRAQGGWEFDESTECTIVMLGSGMMPETLTVSIATEWDGRDEAAPAGEILLTVE